MDRYGERVWRSRSEAERPAVDVRLKGGVVIFDVNQPASLTFATARFVFAFGILQCGGVMPTGKTFRDTVRITFCLEQRSEGWRVVHQHVSKPMG